MTIEDARAYRRQIETAAALQDDETAVDAKWMYPLFKDVIGQKVKKGFRLQHNGKLWKTEQPDYTIVEQYAPGDPGTEALFSEVEKEGQGTHDNPIPYNNNMELFEGKYYSHKGGLYYCFRSTGQPVYADLDQLIDLYVRVSN